MNQLRKPKTVRFAAILLALLVGISGVVLNALSIYYVEITSVVCLPVP